MTKKYIHLTIAKVFLFLSFIITAAFCLAQDTTSVSFLGETPQGEIIFFDDQTSSDIVKLKLLKAKNTTFCQGDSVLLYSNIESNSYGWLKDGEVIRGANNDSLWVSCTGNYQLICEISNNRTRHVKSERLLITEADAPNVSVSAFTNELCPGDSIKLTSSFKGTSQWCLNGKPISGANSNTYYAKTAGAYNTMKTNISGCIDSSDVSFIITEVKVEDCSLKHKSLNPENIIIYPNPASTHLYIENKTVESSSILMTDGNGKIVLSESGITNRIYKLDVTQFKAGIYFIEINDKNLFCRVKVILD